MYFQRIAQNLRLLRRARHLTQERLAQRADVSSSQIRMLENGTSNPTIYTLLRICDALSIAPETLFSSDLKTDPPAMDPEEAQLLSLLEQLPEPQRAQTLQYLCDLLTSLVKLLRQ